jgi:RimJ/RimL family protein N-acetyltransferase
MPAPEQSKRNVRIDSEKYLIRTIEPDDASDRWASWMSDPEVVHMLNLRARTWKKADVLDYIKTFDQLSSLLLGIFEKQSGTHIGVFTVDINQVRSQFLVNLLIGEPEYRNKHVTSSIAMPFHEYFFETLGLNMAVASVLAHNAPMIHYLKKNGWKLDQTVKHGKKSNADGAMLDVCLFSLPLDACANGRKKILRRSSQPEGRSPCARATTKAADRPGARDRWSEEFPIDPPPPVLNRTCSSGRREPRRSSDGRS